MKNINHIALDLYTAKWDLFTVFVVVFSASSHTGSSDKHYFEFTAHLQCCETLLSPAGVVETTKVVAVEWEPSAFDSCDDTGLSVERGVRRSGAPEGAVVKWGVASACDTPPEGGGKSSASLVSGVNPDGGEDVGGMSFLGAAAKKGQ